MDDTTQARPAARVAAAEEIAAHPDAARWARDCAWLPGTGYCPGHRCSQECVFRAQRESEARLIIETRRSRRTLRRILSAPVRLVPCGIALSDSSEMVISLFG